MSRKKDEIINLTLNWVKKKGFLSFSYDDISKELNITKAAIHYHFEKKEDLGLAVCERIEKNLMEGYEKALHDISEHNAHPWRFIENRIGTIKAYEICPISSFQSDYEYLPVSVKEKIKDISAQECECLSQLIKKYAPHIGEGNISAVTLMSVKGVLQYRRILGEDFYEKTLDAIKEDFFNSLLEEGK